MMKRVARLSSLSGCRQEIPDEPSTEEGTRGKSNECANGECKKNGRQSGLTTMIWAAKTEPVSRECQLQKVKSFKKRTRKENHRSLR